MRSAERFFAILSFLLLPTLIPVATAATDWVVDLMPGTVHANLAASDFSVTGPNGKETLSLVSSIPSIAAGVAIDTDQGYLDLKGGGGMLLNSKLSSFYLYGLAGWYHEIQPSVLIGPHAALTWFTPPEWWGDTDISFDGTMGYMFGFHIAAGDRIAYLLSADYFSAAFDVKGTGPGVTASNSSLDMSGIAVQFGVRVRF